MAYEHAARLQTPESSSEREVEIGRLIRSVQEVYESDGKTVYGVVHDWYDEELGAEVEFIHHGTHAFITILDDAEDDMFRVDMEHEDAAVRWYDGVRCVDVTLPGVVDTEDFFTCLEGVLQRRLDNEASNNQFAEITHEYLMPSYDVLEPKIARIAMRHHEAPTDRDLAIAKLTQRILRGSWWSRQRRKKTTPLTGRRYLDEAYVVMQLQTWVTTHPLYGAVPKTDREPAYHTTQFELIEEEDRERFAA